MLAARLPRWQHLVTPAWLRALIAGRPVVAAPAASWRLFEVGWRGMAAFLEGHVPGAAYIEVEALERPPLWNKVPDETLLQVLLAHGIRHDTPVLLYGRHPLVAARVAHLLLYAGVGDVRLLDGGYAAWEAAGGAVEAGRLAAFAPARSFGARFPAHREYLVDTHQVKDLMARADGVLVSIRSRAEHLGQTSGYAYIAARGDIPGARWGRAGADGDVDSMSAFQRPDGTMRSPDHIQAFWREAGICREQRTTFYCGTGWRASLAFFYAWLMRWERISVYDGGWLEWSRQAR
jgi:thiosulfate/3-mercaptopyruvate sulfurtransferase